MFIMEALDDDDFSDLYADVEVQASSAIRALNELKKMPPPGEIISDDATGGEKGKGYNFSVTEIARGNGEIYDRATVGEDCGCLTELPSENGVTSDGGSENKGSDGIKQKFGVTNMGENGGPGTGADEMKHVVIDGNEKSMNSEDYDYSRENLKYDSSISKKRKVDDVAHQLPKLGKNDADADVSNDGDDCSSRASEDNDDCGDKVASESLQVSDSEGDNHQEMSDCDSDELLEKSGIANRRNASNSSSDKVPSLAESESSQSGWSHHSPVSSSPTSASAALSNDGIENRRKHSKNTSSITRDYHHPNYSRSRTIKPSIKDGRYSQRRRGIIGKELNQHREYSDMPNSKTYLTDEDDSYANYVERNRHTSNRKRREVMNFNSNEKDIPYYNNQSESVFTQFGGFFPDYHLKNRNSNIHPISYKYKRDGHYTRERRDFIGKTNSKMDYEDNWYHKQRRYAVQCNMEVSRKLLLPKYHSSAVNTRDTLFSNRGDAMHFKRTKRDYFPPLRDYPDHRYGQNIAHERRETESYKRGNRESNNPRIILNNPHMKNRPRPFYSHLAENQHVRSKHYEQSTSTYINNERLNDHYDQNHFSRRRETEALHSREDTLFHSEGPSYNYTKNLRNNRPDTRHGFGHTAEFIGEREIDRRRRFTKIREENSRNQFDGRLKIIDDDKRVRMRQRCQYSVDSRLVVVDKKFTTMRSSRRITEAGDDFICGENDPEDLECFNRENAALTNERKVDTTNLSDKNWQDKFFENPKDQFLDIEEGQIIGEEINNHSVKSVIVSQDNTETASNSIAVVETLGEDKIQEIIAKMERRRERFKEQIINSGKDDLEKSSNLSLNLAVGTSEGKLGRPARKRKWF